MAMINKAIARTKNNSSIRQNTTQPLFKQWLLVGLAAAALTLSACGGKQEEKGPIEGATLQLDSETSEAQAAAEVAAARAPMLTDREDNPVLPSNDEPENTATITSDGVSVSDSGTTNPASAHEGVADAGLNDDEILDGSESSEHISTY